MYVPLDRDSALPLPRQISTYLEELIRHGHLGPGGRLPATRTLARSLGVSKGTVESAYEELAARGLVRVRPGQDVTVRAQIPESRELGLPFRRRRGRDPLPAAAWLKPAGTPERIYDLAGEGPRPTHVSARQLRQFHEKALAMSRRPLFSPPPPLGDPALREAASRHLARCGILRSPEEVGVLVSREEVVRRVLQLYVPRRGFVLVDSDIGPELALPIRERGARLQFARRGRGRGAARLLVVTSGGHGLVGSVPDLSRRHALLDLARERGIPILEDVTGAESLATAPPPLSVLDRSGRVLSLQDLSDEIGGAFSAATIAGTTKALDRLRRTRPGPEKPLERLGQRALAEALEAPGHPRSLRKLQEKRKLLKNSLARAIRRRLAEVGGHEFSAGAEVVRVDLPEDVSPARLQQVAARRGVLVRSSRDCGLERPGPGFVLLDLTRHEEGDLLEGIRMLGEAFDELVTSS